MKKFLLPILVCFTFVSSYSGILAQSPDPIDSVTNDIKERVQKVLQGEDPKVQGTATKETFAVVGTLEKSVGSTLQVKTYSGENRIIEVFKTAMIVKANKPITKEELELNSPIIVMGSFEGETYIGKRIVVGDDTLLPTTRDTIWGRVTALTTKALTLLPLTKVDGVQAVFPLTTTTKYYNIIDQVLKRTDMKISDEVIVVTANSTTASGSALRVYSLVPPTATP